MGKVVKYLSRFLSLRFLVPYLILQKLVSAAEPQPPNTKPVPTTDPRTRTPEISISGYVKNGSFLLQPADEKFKSQSNYKNEFVSKTGNDFVVSAETKLVMFTCEANYPVIWKFSFPTQLTSPMDYNLKSVDYRGSHIGTNFPGPVNAVSKSVISLELRNVTFLSVNLTCISPENKTKIEPSIHVYVGGTHKLEHEGKTINITVDKSGMKHLTLPCRPSSPSVKLALEKASGTKWTRFNTDSNFTFDPKIGFTIESNVAVGNETRGLYRCSVINKSDDGTEYLDNDKFVLVNVTSGSGGQVTMSPIFEPRSILQGDAKVNVQIGYSPPTYSPRHHIVCCSGVKDKPPKLYALYCSDPLNCEIQKNVMTDNIGRNVYMNPNPIITIDDQSGSKSTGCNGIAAGGVTTAVICKGENVDYAGEFTQVFHPELSGPVLSRSERVGSVYVDHMQINNPSPSAEKRTILSKYVPGSIKEARVNLNERMAIIVAGRIDISLLKPHRAAHKYSLGFNQICDDNLLDAVDDAFSNYCTAQNPNRGSASYFLNEYDRDVLYEGESPHFICLGLKPFYAKGPRMGLNYRNGTKSILEPEPVLLWKERRHLFLDGPSVMFNRWGDDLVNMFSKKVVVSQDMSSVDCWMPSRNSSRWDKISKPLKVLPAIGPKFHEKLEEAVNFSSGDVNKEIICTAVDGLPLPEITVTKDGIEQRVEPRVETKAVTESKAETDEKKGTRIIETVDKIKNLVKVNIVFDVVTSGDQADWKCIAGNVKENVTRTIKVFVKK